MAIQTQTLSGAEHDWFATQSGLPANAPLSQHKAVVFGNAGVGGVSKPLSQMEREWLQNFSNSNKLNEGDLWREAVSFIGLSPSVSTSENKFLFYTSTTSLQQATLGPVTSVLDDFNRADSTTTLGANWSLLKNFSGALANQGITSNQAYNPTAAFDNYSAMYWNPTTFANACEVYMTISTKPTNDSDSPGIYLGCTSPGASFNGYVFGMNLTAGDMAISKVTAGTQTDIGARVTQAVASGDTILFRRVGTRLRGYIKKSGVWTLVLTRIDSTFQGAGSIGLYFPGNKVDGRFDDFGGGNV